MTETIIGGFYICLDCVSSGVGSHLFHLFSYVNCFVNICVENYKYITINNNSKDCFSPPFLDYPFHTFPLCISKGHMHWWGWGE